MGKLYNYIGFIIYFYSNKHYPVHVHVRKDERESKFEFHYNNGKLSINVVKVFAKNPLTGSEVNEIKNFLVKYQEDILQKWNDVFILHKKTNFEIINKRVK